MQRATTAGGTIVPSLPHKRQSSLSECVQLSQPSLNDIHSFKLLLCNCTSHSKKPHTKNAGRCIPNEVAAYLIEVGDALIKYGDELVFNMDEVPVDICDPPLTAVTSTASGKPAEIQTSFMTHEYLTIFPTISASGRKQSQFGSWPLGCTFN
jgi:hypothetical protein